MLLSAFFIAFFSAMDCYGDIAALRYEGFLFHDGHFICGFGWVRYFVTFWLWFLVGHGVANCLSQRELHGTSTGWQGGCLVHG